MEPHKHARRQPSPLCDSPLPISRTATMAATACMRGACIALVLVSQAAPATSLAEPRRAEKHIQNRSAWAAATLRGGAAWDDRGAERGADARARKSVRPRPREEWEDDFDARAYAVRPPEPSLRVKKAARPAAPRPMLTHIMVLVAIMTFGLTRAMHHSAISVLGINRRAYKPWQLITHMFAHENVQHLMVNMFEL
jgi:membrane associated rhomboid family serine protease